MTTLTQIAVPFHNAELYLVEHNGQPYVPMRPVVEGMGLTWASQTVKFNSNKARWGVSIIETPTLSGIQEMLCIPLRKLFGWFTSISPNKVKPELRDTVIMYQNECDDVLWDYWSKGRAINQRHTITPEQKSTLQEIVERKAGDQRALRAQIWTRHNRHFNI
ncbi:phage antirepressor N-terminal domain-containing protein, partial [Acinetobacter pittii]